MKLPDTDCQILLAIQTYGRHRLRALWCEQQGAELRFDTAQRRQLAAMIQAERLPWQPLQDQLEETGAEVIFAPQLPVLLQQIPDPPLALYLQGAIEHLTATRIAMVGARRASRRSLLWTEQTAAELCALGHVVVSGMAFGVDAAAHRGALASGRTLAVLGSGLARPSPRSHHALMRSILNAGGTVVSEYSLTQEARKHYFPERNRLVTGLSLGVVVVEGGARSGSLISARLALEQGREVMAVPGPVGMPGSAGCHRLLKQGAALVEHCGDICAELGLSAAPPAQSSEPRKRPDNDQAAAVLAQVDALPTTTDQLLTATGLSAPQLTAVLTRLEVDGFVQLQAGGYIRTP